MLFFFSKLHAAVCRDKLGCSCVHGTEGAYGLCVHCTTVVYRVNYATNTDILMFSIIVDFILVAIISIQ